MTRRARPPARDAMAKVSALCSGRATELAGHAPSVGRGATVAYYPFDEAIAYRDDKLPTPRPRQVAPANLVAPTRHGGCSGAADAAQPPPAAAANGGADNRLRGLGRASRRAGPRRNGQGGGTLQLRPDAGGVVPVPGRLRSGRADHPPSAVAGAAPAVLQAPISEDGVQGQGAVLRRDEQGVPRQGRRPLRTDAGVQPRFLVLPGPGLQVPSERAIGRTGKGLPYGVPIIQHRDDDNAGGSATGCSSKTGTCGCISRTRGRRT